LITELYNDSPVFVQFGLTDSGFCITNNAHSCYIPGCNQLPIWLIFGTGKSHAEHAPHPAGPHIYTKLTSPGRVIWYADPGRGFFTAPHPIPEIALEVEHE
jgi:hypothetical protein